MSQRLIEKRQVRKDGKKHCQPEAGTEKDSARVVICNNRRCRHVDNHDKADYQKWEQKQAEHAADFVQVSATTADCPVLEQKERDPGEGGEGVYMERRRNLFNRNEVAVPKPGDDDDKHKSNEVFCVRIRHRPPYIRYFL
jgi:hypothetical protein